LGKAKDVQRAAAASLFLGLLYHGSKPMSLFERIGSSNTDILLVDTALSLLPGAHLRIVEEKPEDRRLFGRDAAAALRELGERPRLPGRLPPYIPLQQADGA
jgi:hypothetical protein